MKMKLSTLCFCLSTLLAGVLTGWMFQYLPGITTSSREVLSYLVGNSPFAVKLCALGVLLLLLSGLILAFCTKTQPRPYEKRYNGVAALSVIYYFLIQLYWQVHLLLPVFTHGGFTLAHALSLLRFLFLTALSVGLCMDYFLCETSWHRHLLWIFPLLTLWDALPLVQSVFHFAPSEETVVRLLLTGLFFLFALLFVLRHFTQGLGRKASYLCNAVVFLCYVLYLLPHYVTAPALWEAQYLGTDLAVALFLFSLLLQATTRLSVTVKAPAEEPARTELPGSEELSAAIHALAEETAALTSPSASTEQEEILAAARAMTDELAAKITEQPQTPPPAEEPAPASKIPPLLLEIPKASPSVKKITSHTMPLQIEPDVLSGAVLPQPEPTLAPQTPAAPKSPTPVKTPAPMEEKPAAIPPQRPTTTAPKTPAAPVKRPAAPVSKSPASRPQTPQKPAAKKPSGQDLLAALDRQISSKPTHPSSK